MNEIIAYAGVGSRAIDDNEVNSIKKISTFLRRKGLILYSGNASGSDITFQRASRNKCVIMLPYDSFNKKEYEAWNNSLATFACGNTTLGNSLTEKFHPNPSALTWKSKPMMNRNAHQIHGKHPYPKVKFVVCCANEDKQGNVLGGTGHACRIAKSLDIPVINIRSQKNYMKQIKEIVEKI